MTELRTALLSQSKVGYWSINDPDGSPAIPLTSHNVPVVKTGSGSSSASSAAPSHGRPEEIELEQKYSELALKLRNPIGQIQPLIAQHSELESKLKRQIKEAQCRSGCSTLGAAAVNTFLFMETWIFDDRNWYKYQHQYESAPITTPTGNSTTCVAQFPYRFPPDEFHCITTTTTPSRICQEILDALCSAKTEGGYWVLAAFLVVLAISGGTYLYQHSLRSTTQKMEGELKMIKDQLYPLVDQFSKDLSPIVDTAIRSKNEALLAIADSIRQNDHDPKMDFKSILANIDATLSITQVLRTTLPQENFTQVLSDDLNAHLTSLAAEDTKLVALKNLLIALEKGPSASEKPSILQQIHDSELVLPKFVELDEKSHQHVIEIAPRQAR